MYTGLIAEVSTSIHAQRAKVWHALIDPETIRQFMFGTEVVTDWKVGGPILWKGVWEGKPYEDKGVLLKVTPEHTLQYSHFSPLGNLPDMPENYHTVTYELSDEGDNTLVSLTQDNNSSETAMEHSQKMWEKVLDGLKEVLEK